MGKSALVKATAAVTVTPANYAGMTATALDNLIKAQHTQCKALYSKLERNSETLYLALEEMERRFEKQQRYRTDLKPLKAPTWHGYLQSRGVQPAAYRKWKSRRNQAARIKTETSAPVEVNVLASRLVAECESLSKSLATVVESRGGLDPAIAKQLTVALSYAARIADPLCLPPARENLSEDAKAARALRQAGELKKVPLHLRQANELVAQLHRHHKPIHVAKFSIGVEKDGQLCGAAICMRPASRALDDGKTVEVCRLVTDGTDNACSLLYAACAKTAKEMGYSKIQTYLLDSEPGTSLKGAGWVLEKTRCGGTAQGFRKNRPNGHKITDVTFETKQRWVKLLNSAALPKRQLQLAA